MFVLRNRLFPVANGKTFHHRGTEILRIEALSDAVFAFSVSLLVASLEVPQTFGELLTIAKGAIPFFATVALLFIFWYHQYVFFRRYGLNDLPTIVLNLAYLAVILFYVYPLKFLFSLLISSWSGINLFPKAAEKGLAVLTVAQFPDLVVLFSTGYFLVWGLLYLMYRRVFKLRHAFRFNRYELLLTEKEKRGAFCNSLIGLLAIVLSALHLPWLAGVCYLFIPLVLFVNHRVFQRREQRPEKVKRLQ